jgi:hypothetical protein
VYQVAFMLSCAWLQRLRVLFESAKYDRNWNFGHAAFLMTWLEWRIVVALNRVLE